VNYQMTGIRLSAVGPDPARFDPLELSFVNLDGTGPEDVVLYLPNTGGKTVLLRLLFGVLQPQAAERVGS
jgi:ABC-type transport system involved in cytochrome c biogenesis ATPase subunit